MPRNTFEQDVENVIRTFGDRFGGRPEVVTSAPGRVNLIGEHTDYNDGFVFPVAIDRRLTVAARPTTGPSRLISLQKGEARPFDVAELNPLQITDWSKYAAGMAWVLQQEGYRSVPNVEAVVTSSVPIGSGVSSSAALELAFGVLYNALGRYGLDNKELAVLGQKCENKFVGMNCGIMDQMASAMGRDDAAMFLDTRSLEIEYATIPKGLAIVLCDTKTPRALTDSAYNERRSQCETAALALGVPALRDATMEMLNAQKGTLEPVVYRRAFHIIGENQRCLEFIQALNTGDLTLAGILMRDSHSTLRDDYQVSCRELNVMSEAANSSPGCIGARMTGAGFGGACVALVEVDKVDAFVNKTGQEFVKRLNRSAAFEVCRAVGGAHVVESDS